MIPLLHVQYLAAALFAVGIGLVLSRKNPIIILAGLELMLNAANLNLVAMSRLDGGKAAGQVFALFVMLVAACETAVLLTLIYLLYKRSQKTAEELI